jgi:hypothetical protein
MQFSHRGRSAVLSLLLLGSTSQTSRFDSCNCRSVRHFQEEKLTVTSGKLISHCILSLHLCCIYNALINHNSHCQLSASLLPSIRQMSAWQKAGIALLCLALPSCVHAGCLTGRGAGPHSEPYDRTGRTNRTSIWCCKSGLERPGSSTCARRRCTSAPRHAVSCP